MKPPRSRKLLWWKLPHDPARGGDQRIDAREVPDAEVLNVAPAFAILSRMFRRSLVDRASRLAPLPCDPIVT